MKILTSLLLVISFMSLSGCVFLNALNQDRSSDRGSVYPTLQTFQFEGALIYYKDLSDPCDVTTVAWNDLGETLPIQQVSLKAPLVDCESSSKAIQAVAVTQFDIEDQISIAFESRKAELPDHGNAKSLASINEFASTNTQFHIYGAAGTIGKRSEALGLERATTVRDQLISMGIQHERITIMPYDPLIPGLQALVKVVKPVIL